MFQFFKDQIDNLPDIQIEKKYPEVFDVFNNGYIDIALKKNLIKAIREIENGHINIDLFNPLRKILEAILLEANRLDSNWLPDEMIKSNGEPNLEWSYRYMSGLETNTPSEHYQEGHNKSFPNHISRIVQSFKEITNQNSHYDKNRMTQYTLMHVTYGLMDVLIWFKNYIDENNLK